MTAEQGKPLAEAAGKSPMRPPSSNGFSEEARRVYGDVNPVTTRTRGFLVLRQPWAGGAITP